MYSVQYTLYRQYLHVSIVKWFTGIQYLKLTVIAEFYRIRMQEIEFRELFLNSALLKFNPKYLLYTFHFSQYFYNLSTSHIVYIYHFI